MSVTAMKWAVGLGVGLGLVAAGMLFALLSPLFTPRPQNDQQVMERARALGMVQPTELRRSTPEPH